MRMRQFVASIVVLAFGASIALAGDDTALTYQGRLLDAGQPANVIPAGMVTGVKETPWGSPPTRILTGPLKPFRRFSLTNQMARPPGESIP